jgi:hypothetical protein
MPSRSTALRGLSPTAALIRGGAAFLAAMRVPGRTRLMLLDARAVLGRAMLDQIDAETGGQTLIEGLAAALPADRPVAAMAALLSSAFDRAALEIDAGGIAADWKMALAMLIAGVIAQQGEASSPHG